MELKGEFASNGDCPSGEKELSVMGEYSIFKDCGGWNKFISAGYAGPKKSMLWLVVYNEVFS